jgi:hypothetical protein
MKVSGLEEVHSSAGKKLKMNEWGAGKYKPLDRLQGLVLAARESLSC